MVRVKLHTKVLHHNLDTPASFIVRRSSMATFVFSPEVMNITAPFLDIPVLLPLVAVHGAASGKNFFHCVSKNTKLHRLLVDEKSAPAFGTLKAALRRSGILKRLEVMKDAE